MHICLFYLLLLMLTKLLSLWIGEKAVRECIAQGRKFADASQGPDKGRIRKVCDDRDRLMGDLAELRRQGNVSKKVYRLRHSQILKPIIAYTD